MSWQGRIICVFLRGLRRLPERKKSVAEIRRRLNFVAHFVPHPPRGTQTITMEGNGIPLVQITVPQARFDKYILFFHGGGYEIGTAGLYRDFTWRLGDAARARVLYFDYRLAPEYPFPAAVEDALAAYRWLLDRARPSSIAFAGDSAGGGLAISTALLCRDKNLPVPAALVAMSPWTDLALTGRSLQTNANVDPCLNPERLPGIAKRYLRCADPKHIYASPLYADTTGLPPTLIQVGSDEILEDDSVRMAKKLRNGGSYVCLEIWPLMPHGWHLYARILPEGREALKHCGSFLQERLN